MQATANCTPSFSAQQSSLLRLRDVVARYSVAETTIRRATADGSLACLRLPSGHRRFRESDVLSWLGIVEQEEKVNGYGQIPVAAVIRVSSDGQNRRIGNSDKSSMEHQEGRVREYIRNRWGEKARVIWYRSVGSGMNFERKEFLRLIADILDGKFRGGFIIASDFTRVCRFGIKLVEFLASKGGCEIAYTMATEDKDLNESLTDEILSILTHYTAKASGQKQKQLNETKMDEGKLRDAFIWNTKLGLSYRAIAERFNREKRGHDARGKKITRYVVMKRLEENRATLEKLYGDEVGDKNSFQQFVDKFVRKSISDKTRLSRKRLLEVYAEWATAQELPVLPSKTISKFTTGWQKVFDGHGCVVFCGLSLNTNKPSND